MVLVVLRLQQKIKDNIWVSHDYIHLAVIFQMHLSVHYLFFNQQPYIGKNEQLERTILISFKIIVIF